MRDKPIYFLKERNPAARTAHRRQVLWQITLPFILAILVILGLAVLTVVISLRTGETASRWADVSLIWLILPTMLIAFIFLVIISALAYLVIRLIGVFPEYTYRVQEFLEKVKARLRAASDTAARPVIQAGGFFAAVRVLLGK